MHMAQHNINSIGRTDSSRAQNQVLAVFLSQKPDISRYETLDKYLNISWVKGFNQASQYISQAKSPDIILIEIDDTCVHKILDLIQSAHLPKDIPMMVIGPKNLGYYADELLDLGVSDCVYSQISSRHLVKKISDQIHLTYLHNSTPGEILFADAISSPPTESFEKEISHLKAQLEKDDNIKNEFLSNISHEIRTPLNGVVGATRLLEDHLRRTGQKELYDTLSDSAFALNELLNEILTFAQLEQGKCKIIPSPFNLNMLIDEVTSSINKYVGSKKIQLSYHVPDNIPSALIGDPDNIRKILLNFAKNAIKFTREGQIHLSVEPVTITEDCIRMNFSVEDSGIGIEFDQLKKIFEKFTQVDNSSTREYGGSGLGLAMCKQLAHLMNADIHVSSLPGIGSIFSLNIALSRQLHRPQLYLVNSGNTQADNLLDRIPINAQDLSTNLNAAINIEKAFEDGVHFQGKVLLVEDQVVNQKVATRLLEKMGLKVELAENGVEAVMLCAKKTFDAIVMDCHMPQMDGFQATLKIRNRCQYNHSTPIVALTASDTPEYKTECITSGMNDFLTKPIQPKVLYHTLSKYLQLADC